MDDRLSIVEAISPDGTKSLWVVAVAPENAAAGVAQFIPPGHAVKLLKQRLRMTRKSDVLRPGEVRRLRL